MSDWWRPIMDRLMAAGSRLDAIEAEIAATGEATADMAERLQAARGEVEMIVRELTQARVH